MPEYIIPIKYTTIEGGKYIPWTSGAISITNLESLILGDPQVIIHTTEGLAVTAHAIITRDFEWDSINGYRD